MTLDELLQEAGQPGPCVQVPIWAQLDGERVEVTAVLDRTAVYRLVAGGECKLVRRDQLVVEPDQVAIHPDRHREALLRGRRMSRMRYGSSRDSSPLCSGARWCGSAGGYTNHGCRSERCALAAREAVRRSRASGV